MTTTTTKEEEAHEGDGKAIKQKKNFQFTFPMPNEWKKIVLRYFIHFSVSYTKNIFIQLETMKKKYYFFLYLVNEFFSVNSMKNEHTENNSFCYFLHLYFFVLVCLTFVRPSIRSTISCISILILVQIQHANAATLCWYRGKLNEWIKHLIFRFLKAYTRVINVEFIKAE